MKNRAAAMLEVDCPVRTIDHLGDLDVIKNDNLEAVIWNRHVPRAVLSTLQAGPSFSGPDRRFLTRPEHVRKHVAEVLQDWQCYGQLANEWIAHDVQALAQQLSITLAIKDIALRMEIVDDDACRKFHRDTVKARLICTYHGPGTEYGMVCDDGPPQEILRVPTAMPILLKGKLWPSLAQQSVMHRSPQIADTGISRLVVVLEEAR